MTTLEATRDDNQPLVEVDKYPSEAHYYEIRDNAGTKRAVLTVVLSTQMRVLHAELIYLERYRALEPTQTEIFNRAKEIVESKYLGSGFGSELVVIDGKPLGEEEVKHNNPDPIYQPPRLFRLWKIAATYGAVMLVFLLFGLLNRTVLAPTSPQPATASLGAGASVALNTGLSTADGVAEDVAGVAATTLGGEALSTAGIDPLALQPNTNGLPPSTKANPRIEVGMTVRILPGYRSFIRTAPGPDGGKEVGLLEDGATAEVVGGPIWMPGNTDTIVWWYVEKADGMQGWTPANTSELTLLEPVE
jgi:hypothetical protein